MLDYRFEVTNTEYAVELMTESFEIFVATLFFQRIPRVKISPAITSVAS